MPHPWKTTLRLSSTHIPLRVTDPTQGDILKARLPMTPRHPRALLTLLEGLSLWQGHPLDVVLFAADSSPTWIGSGLFGDELWPAESQLVRYEIALRGNRKRLPSLRDLRAQSIAPHGGKP